MCLYWNSTDNSPEVEAHRASCKKSMKPPTRHEVADILFGAELGHEYGRVIKSFIDASAGRLDAPPIVLDIGCNDGKWTRALHSYAPPHVRGSMLVDMVEPQPHFRHLLDALVSRNPKWRFWPVAAWTELATLNLSISVNSQSTSLVRANALRFGRSPTVRVNAVDVAKLIDWAEARRASQAYTVQAPGLQTSRARRRYKARPPSCPSKARCGGRRIHTPTAPARFWKVVPVQPPDLRVAFELPAASTAALGPRPSSFPRHAAASGMSCSGAMRNRPHRLRAQ